MIRQLFCKVTRKFSSNFEIHYYKRRMWLLTSVRPKPGPLSVSVLEPILFSETKTSNVLMFATSFRDISFWFLGALLRWKKYPSFQYWQLNSLFEMWLRYWLKVSVSVSVLDQNQSSGFGRSLDHTNNQIKARGHTLITLACKCT